MSRIHDPLQSSSPPNVLDDHVQIVSEMVPSKNRPSMCRHSSSVTRLIETYGSASSPTRKSRDSSSQLPQVCDDVFSTPLSARSSRSRSRSMTSPPQGDHIYITTSPASRSLVRKSCIPVKTGQHKFPSNSSGSQPLANKTASSLTMMDVQASASSSASLAVLKSVKTSSPHPPSYAFLQYSPNSDYIDEDPPFSSLAKMNASPIRRSFARPPLTPTKPAAATANLPDTPSSRHSPTTPKRIIASTSSPGPLSAQRSRSSHLPLPDSHSSSPRQPRSNSDILPSTPTSTRKLVRKQSHSRVHREAQTKPVVGHSHSLSMSIPRPAGASSFGFATHDARAANVEPSLVFASPEQLLPAVASADHGGLRKKPSFYKRKRSQTATAIPASAVTDAPGFPTYSPVSEIAKAMPSAKRSDDIIHTISRKLSDTMLGDRTAVASADYFGSAVASTSSGDSLSRATSLPEQHESKRAGGWLSHFTFHRHKSHNNATDSENENTSSSPAIDDREVLGMEKWSFPSRSHSAQSSVSSSAGRKSRTSSFSSDRAGTSTTSHETIPPVPALPPLAFKQFNQDPASPHAVDRQSPPLSTSKRASPRLRHEQRPTTAPSSPSPSRPTYIDRRLRSPSSVSRNPQQSHVKESPRIPTFLCTSNQEAAKEERFLQLLDRSNNSDEGIIKISLTSRKARIAGVA